MAEDMAADEVTAPPRKVLIISAGASHSVALLCTSLFFFAVFFPFLLRTQIITGIVKSAALVGCALREFS